MLNLLYAFKRLLRDRGLIRKLSLLFGASGDQVDSALDASSPVILGRLAEIAEGEDGQERLVALLDASDPEVLSSASDFLERDNTDNDTLLTELFGEDRAEVVGGISDISGVSTNTVGALLPKLAPMLLGFLGRHRSDNDADAAEMQRVVVSERDEIARTDRGAALLGLGTAGAAAGGVAFFGTSGEDNPNPSAENLDTGDVADSDAADSDVADSDVADSDVADSDVADSEKPKPRRIHFDEESGVSNAGVAGAAALGGAAVAGAAAGKSKSETPKGKNGKAKGGKKPAKSQNVASKDVAVDKDVSTGSKKSYSYPDGKSTAAATGSTDTAARSMGGSGNEDSGLGWLWWLLGLLAALIILGLILAQCGSDSDDSEAPVAEAEQDFPVVTTSSAPETTVAPTTVAPATTVAPTTAPPTTVAPTTTTTEAPEPEPEAELGDPLTAGTLIGGFSLANAFADTGAEFQAGIDAQSAVASSGVEFAPFGPFDIDVDGESITMDWNEAPEFDDLERTIEAGSVDQYTFSFDDPVLEGVTASADATQTLVPDVSQPDDNTIVVEFGEGLTLGDGQSAVITLTESEPVEGPAMDALPKTGVESNQIAAVGAAFILLGFGLLGISRRREQQLVTL